MNDEKLFPAPCSMHTANVFLPGSLGPVRREVMLAEDVQDLVDRLTQATRERDQLADAVTTAWLASGLERGNIGSDVCGLTHLVALLAKPDPDGERFRHLVDPDIPGSIRQVGVSQRDNEAYWLTGDDARRAIDTDMKPPEPLPAPDVYLGPPDPFTDRICHNADCWYCKGSGWWRGRPCDGDEIPF